MAALHSEFERVLAAVRAAGRGPVLVLGAVDSGKTTLVRQLAGALAAQGPVWIVAADTGQAWIGPPTTMARARLARPRRRWARLAAERLVFLGATSPAPCAGRAAEAMAGLAREGIPPGEAVLVDTPGLVTGGLAEHLWRRVAQGLRPPLVLAIEEAAELAPVLAPFSEAGGRVITLRPDRRAGVRNRTERTAYRAAGYRRYFRCASLRFLAAERVRVVSALTGRPASLAGRAAAPDCGRLAGLRDAAGRDLALAVIRGAGEKRIAVFTPLESLAEIVAIATGMLRIDPATGEEFADTA